MALDAMEDRPRKKSQAVKHNRTKTQFHRMREQILEGCESFVKDAKRLLAEPNHGVPSVTEIKMAGMRVQDRENFKEQLAAEGRKSANLTHAKLTVEQVKDLARSTELSNDRVTRLGEERVKVHMKLTDMSVLKCWKELKILEGQVQYKCILRTANKAFPMISRMFSGSTRLKTKVLKHIGVYLARTKRAAKFITECLYGKRESDKAVPKRERMFEVSDFMERLLFMRVVEDSDQNKECESTALTALTLIRSIDPHYTYTLQPVVAESLNEEDYFGDSQDSGEQLNNLEENGKDWPCFVDID